MKWNVCARAPEVSVRTDLNSFTIVLWLVCLWLPELRQSYGTELLCPGPARQTKLQAQRRNGALNSFIFVLEHLRDRAKFQARARARCTRQQLMRSGITHDGDCANE